MYETSFSGQLKPRWTRRRGMGWVWKREMRSSWSKASFKHCERHNYCIVIHGCHWTWVTGIYWWYESLSCSLNHPVDCSVKWSMFMLEVTLRRCKIVAIKGHKAFKQWLIGAGNTTHLTDTERELLTCCKFGLFVHAVVSQLVSVLCAASAECILRSLSSQHSSKEGLS